MRDQRGYQFNFSQIFPKAMFNGAGRQKKALTILSILQHHFPTGLNYLSVLDIGASTGIIADFLADHFHQVIGIDIDEPAVRFASNHWMKPNLQFFVGDSQNICFAENRFDVVICAQVYEHVPDAERLMKEIFRVLKPGGVCYFAAGNRLAVMEPHYRLPFLSVIPRRAAHLYMRITGKNIRYHERFLTYWSLKRLVSPFTLIDYTVKIVESPTRFHASYMLREKSLKGVLARLLVDFAYWLFPGYIWLLQKPLQHK